MIKRDRHKALLDIINKFAVASQSDIARRLASAGFRLTQASISRDLDELGIIKVNGRYIRPERPSSAPDFGNVELVAVGSNLIVGRCSSGLASAITVRIDAAAFPEIVGTIAGDDTIFIAVLNKEGQEAAMNKISEMFS